MRFNQEFGITLSSVLSILVGIGVVAIIGVFYWIIKTKRGSEDFSQKYGTLTEGLNTYTKIGTNWNVLILLRWLWTNTVLILFRDHCEFQILSLLITSFLFQCLILLGKPMPSPVENKVSFFNEVMVSLYLYTLMHLTDFFGVNNYRE
jgi:hypothetical protein